MSQLCRTLPKSRLLVITAADIQSGHHENFLMMTGAVPRSAPRRQGR